MSTQDHGSVLNVRWRCQRHIAKSVTKQKEVDR